MTDALLTPAARRFVAALARAVAPDAGRLDGRFRQILRARGYHAAEIRAFLAITPAAASRLRSLRRILGQGGYKRRRAGRLDRQRAGGEVSAGARATLPLYYAGTEQGLLPGAGGRGTSVFRPGARRGRIDGTRRPDGALCQHSDPNVSGTRRTS